MTSITKWVAAVSTVIESEGGICDRWMSTGGGHLKFTISHLGETRNLFTGASVSDHRALANVRRDVRKLLRDMEQQVAGRVAGVKNQPIRAATATC